MVQSSWHSHCKKLPSSFDECRTGTDLWTKPVGWATGSPVGSYSICIHYHCHRTKTWFLLCQFLMLSEPLASALPVSCCIGCVSLSAIFADSSEYAVPWTLSMTVERAFCVTGPSVWDPNSRLPVDVWLYSEFACCLKWLMLFSIYFSSIIPRLFTVCNWLVLPGWSVQSVFSLTLTRFI